MQTIPFLELMKMPMNIGSAVIEGGQVGVAGGNPLMATAAKIEQAIKKPFTLMAMGGQLPMLPELKPLAAPLDMLAPTAMLKNLGIGSEYVGKKEEMSGHKDVMTSIY